jgi:hypothetical protein
VHEGATYLRLDFSPGVDLVPLVWRFVNDLYATVLPDRDATSRVALATHELLENGVKYSADRCTGIEIEVVDDPGGKRVTIRSQNKAHPDHRAVVRALIEEIDAAPDAFAFYQKRMRQSARRSDGSGLGLARIRAESEMSLRCDLRDDVVVVTAECCVP